MRRQRWFVYLYGPIAFLVLIVSEDLLFKGVVWVKEWFYLLTWWPYIFLVDWVVKMKQGESLLMDRTRYFFSLIPASTFIWLIFEWFNLTLRNWHYVHLISCLPLRWMGYFISFGTVLPAIFETYELLSSFGVLSEASLSTPQDIRGLYPLFIVVGILSLSLTLSYPHYFFALVWVAFVFLLDPMLHSMGFPSLLEEVERGRAQKIYLILLSGLICGILWEFWNFWALSKWIYTVPLVGRFKLFEMPILGFLGFPPFALECYCITSFLGIFFPSLRWERREYPSVEFSLGVPYKRGLLLLGLIIFYILMFHAIDTHTVLSFAS